ncbi:hypothetical protein ILYODFUR_030423 [Ilyodon furcidens]|uniref:Uncharacterized protein n=1 Tax=Ilyodon furcidens TaxID=33524 RepID=A0ABV0TE70_9TELE
MNLPHPRQRPGSIGSDCRIPRSTCPPSNVTHQLGEPAHTAYQSVNLRFCGLLTSPSLNRFIKSKPCFFLFIIQTILWKKVLCSDEIKIELSGQNAKHCMAEN